ncbi:cyclin family protein [Streptomyces lasiicapitis]|uniref:hypothetical protein n=1 Tax=Streptomyces lasiicapitis TaxID=1923961 RepID=UPI0036507668
MITIDLSPLTAAGKDWDDMAGSLEEVEGLYEARVLSVATNGIWVGVSAGAASSQLAATRREFAAAQVEARAIASILRDAHHRLHRLVSQVRELVTQAREAHMHVDADGRASYDTDELAPYRNDPDYAETVSKWQQAAKQWTEEIKQAVRAVDESDQSVKLALREAAGVKDFFSFDRMAEQVLGRGPDFNGSAVGSIDSYVEQARREEAAERKADAERKAKEEESKQSGAKGLIRGIAGGVSAFAKNPGDVGTKAVGGVIDGLAGATGYNNTEGITIGVGVGWGGIGIGYDISLVRTRTPDGDTQIGIMTSQSKSSSGVDFGFSGKIGVVKSNADDISQLEGLGWDKGASLNTGFGLWGSHQTAIGTTNSEGEGVNTFSYGLGAGAGGGINGGSSEAEARWRSEIGGDE